MSGDVQPRKRKDKRRRKDDLGVEEPRGTAAVFGEGDVFMHSYHDHGTGGHWCAKIIFFSLLAVLVTLVGLIILENRGLSELEANAVESRYSGVLDGWIEDAPVDDHHDEHTLELKHHNYENIHDHGDDDDPHDVALEHEEEENDHNENEEEREDIHVEEDDIDSDNEDEGNHSDDNDLYEEEDYDDQEETNNDGREEQNLEELDDDEDDEIIQNEKYYKGEVYYHANDNKENDNDFQEDQEDDDESSQDMINYSEEGDEEINVLANNDGNDDNDENESFEQGSSKHYEKYVENDSDTPNENEDPDDDKEEEDSDEEIERIEREILDEDEEDEGNDDDDNENETGEEAFKEDEDENSLEAEDIDPPVVEHITVPPGKPFVELEDEPSSDKPTDTLADEEEYEKRQEQLRLEKQEASSQMWLKLVVGGALLVATHAVIRRSTAPRDTPENEENATREETPSLIDRRMTLLPKESSPLLPQKTYEPVHKEPDKKIVSDTKTVHSVPIRKQERKDDLKDFKNFEAEEIPQQSIASDVLDKELYSDDGEDVEDEEDIVDEKKEYPIESNPETKEVDVDESEPEEVPDDVEIIDDEQIEEEIEEEDEDEEEISDVDDAELLSRLEEKYGRLPEPHRHDQKYKDGGNSVEDDWPGEPSDQYWRQQLDLAEQEIHQDWLN